MLIQTARPKKSLKHIVIAACLAVILATGYAALAVLSPKALADTEGAYTFTIAGGEATIDDYDADLGGVNPVIPSTLGGVPVTAIGLDAFNGKDLESVSLPSTLETIGNQAFAGNQLTSISFPSGLTSIGELAFVANQLTSIVLPDSVTTVSPRAFYINNLTSITLSSNMTVIEDSVFGINQLTSFTIPSNITHINPFAFEENQITSIVIPSTLQSLGGWAFDKNPLTSVQIGTSGSSATTTLADYAFDGIPVETVAIEGGSVVIGNYAFTGGGSSNVTSITVSTDVESLDIGNSAFRDATALESLTIPNDIDTTIRAYAFYSTGIKQLSLGDSVTTIGESAFDNTPLESVHLSEGIETIGQWAFGWSAGGGTSPVLDSVFIPNSVTSLGQFPFGYRNINTLQIGTADFAGTPTIAITPASFSDSNIQEVILGNTVVSIGDYAFGGNNIKSAFVPNSVTSLGSAVFSGNPLESLQIGTADFTGTPSLAIGGSFMGGLQTLTTLTLGNNVVSIDGYAFVDNKLEALIIPSSVTSVGSTAFGFNSLQSVTIIGNPTVHDDAFIGNGIDQSSIPDGLGTAETYQYLQDNAQLMRIYADDSDFIAAYTGDAIFVDSDSGNNYITSGYILNPSSLFIEFKDGDGNTLVPSQYYTGYNPSTDTYTTDYAIANSIDATDPDNPIVDFSIYYAEGDTYTITPPAVSGFVTPQPVVFTMGDPGINNYSFVYAAIGDDGDNDSNNNGGQDDGTPGVPNTGLAALLSSNGSVAILSLALIATGSIIGVVALALRKRNII